MTEASSLHFERAWLGGDELVADVRISVADGKISEITVGVTAGLSRRFAGVALPGLVNTHSHAFHRRLRGRTHDAGGDFWTWRDRMYEIAATLTPEVYEEIASAVFVEMVLAGITTVGEFHYLHHQPDGKPYEDPNEMGHALIRAARRAGIRICLLDSCYLAGGISGEPLDPVQVRFGDGDAESWLDRVTALRDKYASDNDVVIGYAPHSIRAVPESELRHLAVEMPGGSPVHTHLSEQPAENEACLAAYGMTPTQYLANIGILGEDTTAVHATHVTEEDIDVLAGSGTGVCYCPSTERDLGDGIGPTGAYRDAGLNISVGSDSHAVIDLFEEARGVELHERLRSGTRGTFPAAELADIATLNGARALGFEGGLLEVGAPADIAVVSLETPRTAGAGDRLGSIIFAASAADVTDVMVAGDWIVRGAHHPQWEAVKPALG